MQSEETIRKKLREIHSGDEQQLKVIFSDANRVIVEAPAGYGKTTTMVSRIAYLYATGRIPNPKQILGLTFSVNAALKVKRDVAAKLPTLLEEVNNPISLNGKINVTNYHGFCKTILKKYERLISESLRSDINLFKAVGDYELQYDKELNIILDNSDKEFLGSVEETIKQASVPEYGEIDRYVLIHKEKLLPAHYVTHTGIILLVLYLFSNFPEVRDFYRDYYPLIIVDEFQDTNCITWELLKQIIGERSQLLFLGDSLQRIYGFIGALPNIMMMATDEYRMEAIPLTKNYRFKDNPDMMMLDGNIRNNAKYRFEYHPENEASLPGIYGNTHEMEAEQISEAIGNLLSQDDNLQVAVLLRGRGKDVEIIQNCLDTHSIKYFYGMFKDDDDDYIQFHISCQRVFLEILGKRHVATNYTLQLFENAIRRVYRDDTTQVTASLLELLHALLSKIKSDYKELLPEERFEFILDVLENRQLKQAMEYINSNVILSTVHGAKGLEWDYVIIADLERWIFPSYICGQCDSKWNKGAKCSLPSKLRESQIESLLDELSVFYVAVTRARIQTYVSASGTRHNKSGDTKSSCYSCMSNLNGIKLVKAGIV